MVKEASERRNFLCSVDTAYAALLTVLERHKRFSVNESDSASKTIEAKTSAPKRSSGETISIKVFPANDNTCDVEVSSSSSTLMGLTDSGKNKENVKVIFQIFINEIEANGVIVDGEHLIYLLRGLQSALYVYEDYVVISRHAVSNGIKGDKTIYYSDITSIQYKAQSLWSGGYIQFSIPGGNESTGGVLDAMDDENTVTLVSIPDIIKETKEVEVVDYLKKKIREAKTGARTAQTVVQQTSAADELKKFKELLDMGVITQEEFDAKKKQLLGL